MSNLKTFHKGHKKLGGRKKGVQNKISVSAKQAFQDAFEKRGGVDALLKWANKNETEFYKIYSKLIPIDLTTDKPISLYIARIDEQGRVTTAPNVP